TITPNLGRVMLSDEEAFSIADIPGLIEGAHLGQGLGIRFLRHVSRTRVLVYVLDASGVPADDFRVVRGELQAFDAHLPERPSLVALNKMDLIAARDVDSVLSDVRDATHLEVIPISADKLRGLEPLVAAVASRLKTSASETTQAECPS
ncbi:MAG TPA: GTPase, partial [Candidatus Binataceae bacterium]|nr:GTPase [Candidatus Binataceae bacterium]